MELILGLEADEPVRRRRPADVQHVHREAGPDARTSIGPANVDLERTNKRDRLGGAESPRSSNLAKEDQADDMLFNEIIWKSVKGADSPMPPPSASGVFGRGRSRAQGIGNRE